MQIIQINYFTINYTFLFFILLNPFKSSPKNGLVANVGDSMLLKLKDYKHFWSMSSQGHYQDDWQDGLICFKKDFGLNFPSIREREGSWDVIDELTSH